MGAVGLGAACEWIAFSIGSMHCPSTETNETLSPALRFLAHALARNHVRMDPSLETLLAITHSAVTVTRKGFAFLWTRGVSWMDSVTPGTPTIAARRTTLAWLRSILPDHSDLDLRASFSSPVIAWFFGALLVAVCLVLHVQQTRRIARGRAVASASASWVPAAVALSPLLVTVGILGPRFGLLVACFGVWSTPCANRSCAGCDRCGHRSTTGCPATRRLEPCHRHRPVRRMACRDSQATVSGGALRSIRFLARPRSRRL